MGIPQSCKIYIADKRWRKGGAREGDAGMSALEMNAPRSIVATTYNNAPDAERIFRAFTFVVELFTAPQDGLAVRA